MTHGWGGNRDADPDARPRPRRPATSASAPLRKAGFNVLTWDSRGFGQSGGTVTVDSKDNEGRDVQALIDWLAKQPEALLDKPGRPARGHARRLLRGRDRARRRRHRPADRRDRARHRLALAADERSTRRRRSRAAGRRALRRRRADLRAGGHRPPAGCRPAPGPAHHLRLRLRREHRQAVAPRTAPGSTPAGPATAGERRSASPRCSSRAPPTRCSRSTRRSPTTGSCAATASRRRWCGSAAATARA